MKYNKKNFAQGNVRSSQSVDKVRTYVRLFCFTWMTWFHTFQHLERIIQEDLKKEIDEDRKNHGKKPLKDKGDNDNDPPSSDGGSSKEFQKEKEQKCSTTDSESGWFHKGEHKQVFAYGVQTACDSNGWILGYIVIQNNK